MPCASCGRWVEGCWIEWIRWHPDHGLELLSLRQSESHGLWYHFFCGKPACRRTSLLIRPVLTACAQDYMAYRYRTIYDKRGNILWRLRASHVPWCPLAWRARGERDSGFNWMIAGGQLLQDDYPVCQAGYYANEWVANDMDICFRTALSCERGTLLRKGIVQLQSNFHHRRRARASLAMRLVIPKNFPDQPLRMVWCFLFGTAPFPVPARRV